jgi:hypothetical protein
MTFDLGDPAFIHTPERVERFVSDVREALGARQGNESGE